MKYRTTTIILLGLILLTAAVAIVIRNLVPSKKYSGSILQVTIATCSLDVSGLIWIGEDQGYFAAEGLNVTVKVFEAGKYAVSAAVNGEADVATASEFVLVGEAMEAAKLETIGSIAKQEFHYIIGRKDRGIEKVSDLKGKRIGLPRRTSAEFYLGRYLELRGINFDDVTPVDLKPTQAEAAIIQGDVDAIAIWDPYAYEIEKSMGRNAVSWPSQSGQAMYWLLIARREYITGHPQIIYRILRSLAQSEEFAVNNLDKAKRIIRNRLRTDEAYAERIWPPTRLALSLDQGLIVAMEDESRWMNDNYLSGARKMPNYLDYIYMHGLEKLKPAAVTIVH